MKLVALPTQLDPNRKKHALFYYRDIDRYSITEERFASMKEARDHFEGSPYEVIQLIDKRPPWINPIRLAKPADLEGCAAEEKNP